MNSKRITIIPYRQSGSQGRLDFERRVQVLRDAESFMDAAADLHDHDGAKRTIEGNGVSL
jgi:hypothetical protein